VLTSECILTPNQIPIPNPEVAFSYKLIKRIVKKRSLVEDKLYLMKQYELSDSRKIDLFLTQQFGNQGSEMIKKFLTIEDNMLVNTDIDYLNKKRRKLTSNFKNKIHLVYWQIKRIMNRILYP